jgi:hypothetical protein
MGTLFKHGYAVLIGVGGNLPVSIKDAQDLCDILIDSGRAGYPSDQVLLVIGENATRNGILDALDRLAELVSGDPYATALIYYSGHGAQLELGGEVEDYCLVPYDFRSAKQTTYIRSAEFSDRINAVSAPKLLVMLDCCHAAGVPMHRDVAGGFFRVSPPESLLEHLAKDSGRVVVTSCSRDQVAYSTNENGVFTACLIEALQGRGASVKDGVARVADVLGYLLRTVPARARALGEGAIQTPYIKHVSDLSVDFPLCYYPGGIEEIKFYVYSPEDERFEIDCIRNILHREVILWQRLARPSLNLVVLEEGDLTRVESARPSCPTFVILLVHAGIAEEDLKLISGEISQGSQIKKNRYLLFFKRTSGLDLYAIDSRRLAAAKKLRESAEQAGVVFSDYSHEQEFALLFSRRLWQCLDSFLSVGFRDFYAPGPALQDKRDAMFYHSVQTPQALIRRTFLEGEIFKSLTSTEPPYTPVVMLLGIGGIGKTTFCSYAVREAFDRDSLGGLFWFNFNEEEIGGVLLFFEAVSSYLGVSGDWRSGAMQAMHALLAFLNGNNIFMVLDGVESLLVADSQDLRVGEFRDRLIREFLLRACGLRSSKVILISRLAPAEIIHVGGCSSYTMPSFTVAEAVKYLVLSDVKGRYSELSEVALHFGCHPLSLMVVSKFVVNTYGGMVTQFWKSLGGDLRTPFSERIREVLDDCWVVLSRFQRKILTLLAVLDRKPSSHDIRAIGILSNLAGVPGDDHALGSFDSNMHRLSDLGFLSFVASPDGEVEIAIHPIVRQLIRTSLASAHEIREAAAFWASKMRERRSSVVKPDISLDMLAREIHFLLQADHQAEAIRLFIDQRANMRFFEAGRHDIGIPIGEAVLSLVRSKEIKRPAADFFTGYLPDHYACTGRIRSAVRIMKTVPIGDHWTALSDQIWILLRGGEYRFAVEVASSAPEWRKARTWDWVLAQLEHYQYLPSCLGSYEMAMVGVEQLLPSYQIRLRCQFATALLDFGHRDRAIDIVSSVKSLSDSEANRYPSEQVHAELVWARIAEEMGNRHVALQHAAIALAVSREICDDYGTLCSLISQLRIREGEARQAARWPGAIDRPARSERMPVSWIGFEADDLREVARILRVTGESDVLYGFPIEGIAYHAYLARRALRTRDLEDASENIEISELLTVECEHESSIRVVRKLREELG